MNDELAQHRAGSLLPRFSPHSLGQWALSWAPWPVWCHTKRAGSQSSVQTDTHIDSLPRSPCSLIFYSELKTSCWRKTRIPNIHPVHSPCFVWNPIINFTDSVKNNQVRRFNEEDWPLVRRTGAETGRAGAVGELGCRWCCRWCCSSTGHPASQAGTHTPDRSLLSSCSLASRVWQSQF